MNTNPQPTASSGLSEKARDIARDTAALQFTAREAVMLDDLQKVLQLDRDIARAQQRDLAGLDSLPDEEAEEMIHVGDITVHQEPHSPAGMEASGSGTSAAGSTISKVLPWLLGPAAGIAAAVGVDAFMGPDEQQPAPPAVERVEGQPATPDRHQWYEYRIKKWVPE